VALPNVIYADSWEHGRAAATTNLYAAVGTTQAISTSTVLHGTRSLRVNPANAATGHVNRNFTGDDTITVVVYVNFATLPGDASGVLEFINASGAIVVRYRTGTGKFELNGGGGAAAFGPVLSTGVWYRITLKIDTTANPGSATAAVNGLNPTTISISQAAATITGIRCGRSSNTTGATDQFYDSLIVTDALADYDFFLGRDHKVEALIPNSDGSHNIGSSGDFDSFTTTAFSNSTTNGNTFIGHRPIQFANTAEQVIRQDLGTTSNYMEFGFENLSADGYTPLGVFALAVHVESATSASANEIARVLLSDGTAVSPDVILSTNDPGTTVTLRSTMLTAPAGGWGDTAHAVIDGLKGRVGFGDNNPDANFIDFMLQVATVGPATFERQSAVDAALDIATAATFFTVFERSTAISAALSVDVVAEFFTVFERQSAIDVFIDIETAGQVEAGFTTHERSAGMGIGLDVESQATFFSILERSAGIDVALEIATAPQRELLRATAVDVLVDLETAGVGFTTFERSVGIDAALSLAAIPQRDLLRSASIGAALDLQVDGFAILERAAAIGAVVLIDTQGFRIGAEIERSVSMDMALDVEAAAEFFSIFERFAGIGMDAAVATAPQRELLRSVSIDASVDVEVAPQRELLRAVGVDALLGIDTSGESSSVVEHERSVALQIALGISASPELRSLKWSLPDVPEAWALVNPAEEWDLATSGRWPLPEGE
jgi:hypothetical protein